jgi:hypothetical protein
MVTVQTREKASEDARHETTTQAVSRALSTNRLVSDYRLQYRERLVRTRSERIDSDAALIDRVRRGNATKNRMPHMA